MWTERWYDYEALLAWLWELNGDGEAKPEEAKEEAKEEATGEAKEEAHHYRPLKD